MTLQATPVETRVGEFDFELGLPTEKTVGTRIDELDFQRAVQCYLWSLPIVGMQRLLTAFKANSGARDGDVATFKGYHSVSPYRAD